MRKLTSLINEKAESGRETSTEIDHRKNDSMSCDYSQKEKM